MGGVHENVGSQGVALDYQHLHLAAQLVQGLLPLPAVRLPVLLQAQDDAVLALQVQLHSLVVREGFGPVSWPLWSVDLLAGCMISGISTRKVIRASCLMQEC